MSLLRTYGIPQEATPSSDAPTLRGDITEVTDERLMGLLTGFTNWSCYIASCLDQARRIDDEAQGAYQDALADAAARILTEKTVAGRKAAAEATPAVRAAKTHARQTASDVAELKTAYENALLRNQAVSRELSRRIAREPHENRTAKWGV